MGLLRWLPFLVAMALIGVGATRKALAGGSVILILVITVVGILIDHSYVMAVLLLPLPLVLVGLWAWPRPRRVPAWRRRVSGALAEESDTTTVDVPQRLQGEDVSALT
ncbi:MAG: hypothetical protein O2816_11170, partial [Planctomycetota bacterium]|nr:hypothetical protein [Planctomycetota bacterium]